MRTNLLGFLRRSKKIPRYWGTATLAQQWWCHQYFIFKARREEETYKKAIEQMQDWGFGPGKILDWGLEGKDYIRLRGEELRTMTLSDLQARLAAIGLWLGDWPADSEEARWISVLGPWPLYPLELERVRALSEEDYLADRETVAQRDYTIWADGGTGETLLLPADTPVPVVITRYGPMEELVKPQLLPLVSP